MLRTLCLPKEEEERTRTYAHTPRPGRVRGIRVVGVCEFHVSDVFFVTQIRDNGPSPIGFGPKDLSLQYPFREVEGKRLLAFLLVSQIRRVCCGITRYIRFVSLPFSRGAHKPSLADCHSAVRRWIYTLILESVAELVLYLLYLWIFFNE